MTDLSKYTHKFRATGEAFQPQHSNGTNKINKRNRQPLSCHPCRLRKLKCDRGHPCETCSKRGDEASCNYGKASDSAASSSTSRSKAQDRLRQLEQLVMQMVDSHDVNSLPDSTSSFGLKDQAVPKQIPTPSSSDYSSTDGHLQYDSGQSKYLGSTHWTAILDNIQELKTAMATENEAGPSSAGLEGGEEDDKTLEEEVLFGSSRSLSLQQILAESLPERIQVNGRLSTYFNSRYLLLPIVHTTQFQRQYDEFWNDPLAAPPLWVSILFSICCMSATLTEKISSEPPPSSSPPASVVFLNAAAQCLVLGGHTTPKRYVVEALALYAMCKYHSSLDPSRMVGIVFSILVRLAYRMGYHRDPSHFAPKFTVFESEMRRRTWAMCRQFDLMVSFQLGLPSNVPPDSWDTAAPSNILDTDFDETTTVLPPSRSEHEATQILYFIVKSRLMTVFGRVLAYVLSFQPPTVSLRDQESKIMALDAEARSIYATVPPPLRIRPMAQCIADPAYLIMVRLNSEFLYHKSICVLHRKYMLRGSAYSAKACVDSAMAIAGHMVDVHAEFMPGGQLYKERWMLNSFTMNDFLLAAVVLCLALSMWMRQNPGSGMPHDVRAQYEMLKQCHEICMLRAGESKESKCVAPALKTVLDKLDLEQTQQAQTPEIRYDIITSTNRAPNSNLLPGLNLSPLSLQDTHDGNIPSHQQPHLHQSGVLATVMSPFNPDPSLNFESLFNFDIDVDENRDNPAIVVGNDIDWTAFDQFLVNPDRFGYYTETGSQDERGFGYGNGHEY